MTKEHLDHITQREEEWREAQRQTERAYELRSIGTKVSLNIHINESDKVYAIGAHMDQRYGTKQDVCALDADETKTGYICIRFVDANEAMLFKLSLNEEAILKEYHSGV